MTPRDKGRAKTPLHGVRTSGADNVPSAPFGRATDAQMAAIGAKHTDSKLSVEAVNPNIGMTNDELSAKGLRHDAYTANCQRCVPAYELRLRGYDVTAKPTDGNQNGVRMWKDGYADLVKCRGGRLFKIDAERIMSTEPNGSRFLVRIKWNGPGAHFFMAKNIGGRIVYEDPQDPTRDAAKFFDRAATGRNNNWVLRVDNREFTGDISDCVEPVKKV